MVILPVSWYTKGVTGQVCVNEFEIVIFTFCEVVSSLILYEAMCTFVCIAQTWFWLTTTAATNLQIFEFFLIVPSWY